MYVCCLVLSVVATQIFLVVYEELKIVWLESCNIFVEDYLHKSSVDNQWNDFILRRVASNLRKVADRWPRLADEIVTTDSATNSLIQGGEMEVYLKAEMKGQETDVTILRNYDVDCKEWRSAMLTGDAISFSLSGMWRHRKLARLLKAHGSAERNWFTWP